MSLHLIKINEKKKKKRKAGVKSENVVTSKIADVSRQIETVEIHLQNLEDWSTHDIHLEMQSNVQ